MPSTFFVKQPKRTFVWPRSPWTANNLRGESLEHVGFWTGALAFTPYLQWRHGHAIHHAKSSQIEDSGIGYFWIFGVEAFQSSPWYIRGYYRFYRNPFILFGIGGLWLFLCEFRLSFRSVNWRQRRGVWLNNLLWAGIIYGMGEWLGYGTFFWLMVPLSISAAFWARACSFSAANQRSRGSMSSGSMTRAPVSGSLAQSPMSCWTGWSRTRLMP